MCNNNKPINAGPSRSSKPSKPKVYPRASLLLDANGKVISPGNIFKGTATNCTILRILQGSHSSVTFHGAKGLDIRPNNYENGVSNNPGVWIDEGPNADPRTICFYGLRDAKENGTKFHTMFDVWDSGAPTHSIFQAVVDAYPDNYVHVRLFGSALAINDKAMGDNVYQIGTKTNGPPPHNWSASRLIQEETAEEILNEVLKFSQTQPNGILDHLILNAHGTMYPNGSGQIICGGLAGGNFDSDNLDLWGRLKGKVRYVWSMNCDAGNDNFLFSSIAKRLSDPAKGFKGWTTGMPMKTKKKPKSIPPNHIEYFVTPGPKHWDGLEQGTTPVKRDLFFQGARHSKKLAVDESALYFNIVAKGEKLPGRS